MVKFKCDWVFYPIKLNLSRWLLVIYGKGNSILLINYIKLEYKTSNLRQNAKCHMQIKLKYFRVFNFKTEYTHTQSPFCYAAVPLSTPTQRKYVRSWTLAFQNAFSLRKEEEKVPRCRDCFFYLYIIILSHIKFVIYSHFKHWEWIRIHLNQSLMQFQFNFNVWHKIAWTRTNAPAEKKNTINGMH